MGIFGWSLPPGVTTLPGEEPEGPCEVCGGTVDAAYPTCVCPECPTCGEPGNPSCYFDPFGDYSRWNKSCTGGMTRDRIQVTQAENRREQIEKDLAEEAAYWEKYAKEVVDE